MLFSILIAHYNNFDYFTECYESIRKQTHQNFEIVLVDDCSTDGSLEKIREYVKEDSRVKIFKNEENKGVGFTKRKCVEMATGDLCGFVDPDDAITPDALEKSIAAYTTPEIVATHSQIRMCDKELKFIRLFPNIKPVKSGNPLFFNIGFSVNHFFTFRKSAYGKTSGINPELTSAVDQDLYLKIYETGELKFIDEPLYLYRLHEKGVSQEKSKKIKLNKNWDQVLRDTAHRRNINTLYGKNIAEIELLQHYLSKKENSFLKKLIKKLR